MLSAFLLRCSFLRAPAKALCAVMSPWTMLSTLIAAGQLYELRFEDLRCDPLGQMHALYETLGLPGFDMFEPQLRSNLASLRDYR